MLCFKDMCNIKKNYIKLFVIRNDLVRIMLKFKKFKVMCYACMENSWFNIVVEICMNYSKPNVSFSTKS